MLNNVIQNRFKKQGQLTQLPNPTFNNHPSKEISLSEPIHPDILKQKLIEKLNPAPKIIMDNQSIIEEHKNEPSSIFLVHFINLFEFAKWYETNKTLFPEIQQKALDTLVAARDGTLGGCACNRERRKMIAEDYFHKFWINNKKTDLPATLLKNLKSKKFILGDFFTYPE